MKIYSSLILLLIPLLLQAQFDFEDSGVQSESDNGLILQHTGQALLNVFTTNGEGYNSFLSLPNGSAIQGAAVSQGVGVVGLSSSGFGMRGISDTSYGVHGTSNSGHGAFFSGSKADGYADIILGAVGNSVNGTIMSDPDEAGSNIFVAANNAVVARIDKNNNGAGSFIVHGTFSDAIFQVDINGNVKVNGTTVHSSDRNRKEEIIAVSNSDILKSIIDMPIYEWQYKDQSRRHVGPMAQDFHKAFGLGDDDKAIAAIDADGVALAAIKAQQVIIQEQAKQLEWQRDQMNMLLIRVKELASDVKVLQYDKVGKSK